MRSLDPRFSDTHAIYLTRCQILVHLILLHDDTMTSAKWWQLGLQRDFAQELIGRKKAAWEWLRMVGAGCRAKATGRRATMNGVCEEGQVIRLIWATWGSISMRARCHWGILVFSEQ